MKRTRGTRWSLAATGVALAALVGLSACGPKLPPNCHAQRNGQVICHSAGAVAQTPKPDVTLGAWGSSWT
jgi:hypothetical protein